MLAMSTVGIFADVAAEVSFIGSSRWESMASMRTPPLKRAAGILTEVLIFKRSILLLVRHRTMGRHPALLSDAKKRTRSDRLLVRRYRHGGEPAASIRRSPQMAQRPGLESYLKNSPARIANGYPISRTRKLVGRQAAAAFRWPLASSRRWTNRFPTITSGW